MEERRGDDERGEMATTRDWITDDGGDGSRRSECGGGGCGSTPMCELCTTRPAALYCRNDGAFLCGVCDAEVHLSNSLSARHRVVPVADYLAEQAIQEQPLSPGSPKTESDSQTSTLGLLNSQSSSHDNSDTNRNCAHCSSFLNNKCNSNGNDELAPEFPVLDLFSEDQHIDATGPSLEDIKLDSCWIDELEKNESSVLDATAGVNLDCPAADTKLNLPADTVEGTGQTKEAAPGCYGPMGMFPYYNGIHLHPNWSPFLANMAQAAWPCMVTGFPVFAPPFSADQKLDRKARVARYLEKRKTRTFENKIRYASRKAYAETRPRIKGRFARREELEAYLREQEAKSQTKRMTTRRKH